MAKEKQYFCYTDGACKKTQGTPGGWGFYIKSPDNQITEKFGWAIKTTISTMELTAICEALRFLPDAANAVIFSDSQSALDYCSKQILIWKKNDWKSCDPRNIKIFKEIDSLLSGKKLKVEWTWIRSHNGNLGNERADALADEGARKAKKEVNNAQQ